MTEVKMSRFIAELQIEKDGLMHTAVFQTMTGAFIVVPETVWSSVKLGPGCVHAGMVETLLRQGFLLDKTIDEDALCTSYRQQIVHDFSTLRTKTLMSRECNLSCTYCILDAERKSMFRETALAVDRFLFELVMKRRPHRIDDLYSGGEVLLNSRVLLESASRRFHYYTGCGIEYGFEILTNGTLLTRNIVSRLKEVGLKGIRVSIAGPAAVHDKLRPSRDSSNNGGKTYNIILRNLEAISGEHTPIFIQTQYDSSSMDYLLIPDMMDDLVQHGIPVSNVLFTPIMAGRREPIYGGGTGDPEKYLYLLTEAEKRGYEQFRSAPSNTCWADYRARFTIDTDGSIIPCPSLQSGEVIYGHVSTGIDFVAESQLLQRKLPDQCLKNCALLPRCWGGCRINALGQGKSFDGIDCQAEVLQLVLEEYISRQARVALSSTGALAGNRSA